MFVFCVLCWMVLFYLWWCVGIFVCVYVLLFFFFKQKTAYEMRISDWSSDVCSSDLLRRLGGLVGEALDLRRDDGEALARLPRPRRLDRGVEGEKVGQIGRASCRERVCQYV